MTSNKCVLSDTKLRRITSLENFPVFMGATNKKIEEDLTFDLYWAVSETGVIQLENRYPLELLYAESHNSGAIGEVWESHHKTLARIITSQQVNNVLEVGGGHGILSRHCMQKAEIERWTIFEPNPVIEFHPKIDYIEGFFSVNALGGAQKYDCVVHSHLFEHLYDPLSFLRDVNYILDKNGKMIFSVPDLDAMLNANNVSALDIEHTIYHSEEIVDALLVHTGFELIEKCKFGPDHSIMYAVKKIRSASRSPLNAKIFKASEDKYRRFLRRMDDDVESLQKILESNSLPLFYFGAHIFSQYYIYRGVICDQLEGILDNDASKIGKRLYGTNVNVFSPEIVSHYNNVSVIVRMGPYQQEVIKQLKKLNSEITIL